VWFLVCAAAISGLLFGEWSPLSLNLSLFRQTANAILPCTGYDTGVISGTLVSIGTDLDDHLLTSGQKELITSATTLGALIGGLASGVTSDYIGRKWVIGVASVIFVVGALIQGVAHQVSVMVGGRFVIGEKSRVSEAPRAGGAEEQLSLM
jgi:MFS family permease